MHTAGSSTSLVIGTAIGPLSWTTSTPARAASASAKAACVASVSKSGGHTGRGTIARTGQLADESPVA